ncbi:hypothetical protein [Maricaulis sp.]|uniref:hypothetical protein n=1 Tax=Maricaulis sp. TaxID=1486257 RepID=UPI00329A054A
MKNLVILSVAGLALTACATSGGPSESRVEAARQAAIESGELVCRERRQTGSQFRRQTCLTPEDWARMEGDVDTAFRDINRGEPLSDNN